MVRDNSAFLVSTQSTDLVTVNSETLEALAVCIQACAISADFCQREMRPEDLLKCSQACLQCADTCNDAVRLIDSRGSIPELFDRLLACVLACRACADECSVHFDEKHQCSFCAEICLRCHEKCNQLIVALSERA